MQPIRRQRGAILIMTAILIVVLIGVAALAMDVGRLVVLRSQMQNAVDAAALAAAVELDGSDGSRERAKAAAREALLHDKSFATIRDLLGPDGLPDEAFTFYCVIGAEFDVDPDEVTDFGIYCNGTDDGTGRYESVTDAETHYVRVELDPETAQGHFTLDLFFLPVLNVLTPGTATQAAARTDAIAGRHSLQCNFAPMAICDPFEGTGRTFRDDMPTGASIVLRDQGGGSGSWSPGNMGFLTPISGEPGADAASDALAAPEDDGCAVRRITTEPGQMTQRTTLAVNTRFDEYGNPGFPVGQWSNWPPAPNIHEYQDVDTRVAVSGLDASFADRFSMPDWKYDDWRAAQEARFGAVVNPPAPPSGLSKPLRYDVYKWEIANNRILSTPTHTPGSAERRVFSIAVISCEALGVAGRVDVPVNDPDGFAKIFLHRKATEPANAAIYGEYLEWSGPEETDYRVEVQLYD